MNVSTLTRLLLVLILAGTWGIAGKHAAEIVAGSGSVGVSDLARYQADDDDNGFGDDDDDDTDVVPEAPEPVEPGPVAGPPDDDDGLADDDDDDTDDRPVDRPTPSPTVDADRDDTIDGFRPGQAIVRLVPGASIDAYQARYGAATLAALDGRDTYLLQLPAVANEPDFVQTLAADPEVVWVELNYTSQAPEGRPGRFFPNGDDVPTTADPGTAYALEVLGVEAAWPCATGAGVTVAVIDTGVDVEHPALADRITDTGWNVLENTADVADVGNGLDDDGNGLIDEMTGHGTHVAGIVAQVAPDAAIMPVKALNSDGVGDAFYLAAGIYHAIDNDASVINLSLGSTHNALVVTEAIREASAAGRVVVAAGGNMNRTEPAEYPATGGTALGVAATDANDAKSDFSNYHPSLAISAPGTQVVSSFPGGGYVTWSGTSMATPFVSGAAALLFSNHPTWTAGEVQQRLTQTATDVTDRNPSYAGLLGSGRLDIAAAVGCGEAASDVSTSR